MIRDPVLVAVIYWIGLLVFFTLAAAIVEWRERSLGCTCSRHRWDPRCPVHGREVA